MWVWGWRGGRSLAGDQDNSEDQGQESETTSCRPNPKSSSGPVSLSDVLLDGVTPAHLHITRGCLAALVETVRL